MLFLLTTTADPLLWGFVMPKAFYDPPSSPKIGPFFKEEKKSMCHTLFDILAKASLTCGPQRVGSPSPTKC